MSIFGVCAFAVSAAAHIAADTMSKNGLVCMLVLLSKLTYDESAAGRDVHLCGRNAAKAQRQDSWAAFEPDKGQALAHPVVRARDITALLIDEPSHSISGHSARPSAFSPYKGEIVVRIGAAIRDFHHQLIARWSIVSVEDVGTERPFRNQGEQHEQKADNKH
jgi:hypothetical protein